MGMRFADISCMMLKLFQIFLILWLNLFC